MIRLTTICLFILLITPTFGQSQEKLTDAARRLASADYPHVYWVYVNAGGWSDTPVSFSDEAVERRARAGVEPDSLDYPVAERVIDSLRAAGLVVRRASRWLKAVTVEAEPAVLGKLAAFPFVDSIDVRRVYHASVPPQPEARPEHHPGQSLADPIYGFSERQNEFVNAPVVHDLGLDGEGVRLAVLDTGFDILHPGLQSASIVATWDFINNRPDVTGVDCADNPESDFQNSHGTWALGVMAAWVPDTLIGIAPGADYILAKTEITCDNTEIRLEEDNWIAAAEWADSIGADIITSSLGYNYWQDDENYQVADLDGNTALMTIAADIAASRNILMITSAGNERSTGWNRITFPADADSVLAVGATYDDSTITTFSSPGPTADGRIKPDVATLGVNVLTLRAEPARGFRYVSGTSFAAPLVAGVAALAIQGNPELTAREVFHLLTMTADRAASPDNDYGHGLIDAYKAADFIHFEQLPAFQVRVGETTAVAVQTAGGAGSTPVIDAIDIPEGVSLIDNGDGTALVTMIGLESAAYRQEFILRATANNVSDTETVILETFGRSARAVYAGPNPFRDSVYIYTDSTAGRIEAVSIFNVAGEKIWEKVNRLSVSADAISRWDRVVWPGRTPAGKPVAAGVYIVQVTAEHRTALLKVLKLD